MSHPALSRHPCPNGACLLTQVSRGTACDDAVNGSISKLKLIAFDERFRDSDYWWESVSRSIAKEHSIFCLKGQLD
jgi:hypothetical protein